MMYKMEWNSQDFNTGCMVSITIEANMGDEGQLATVLQKLVAPTMAEPGVKLFLPYRSPSNPSLVFVSELYVDQAAWSAH